MNEKKRNVLKAAQRLFVEKGFPDTSIQDILEEAKISKGTFYNYFNSKKECLISIIEASREDVNQKRRELSMNSDSNSPIGFAKQIDILWKFNQENNLAPIFDTIFQSNDPDLKKFIRQNYLQEIQWLSSRFIDIYGKKALSYSYDCAILFSGMLRQMIFTWNITRKEPVDTLLIIQFVLKRMDIILLQLIEEKDSLLGEYVQSCTEQETVSKKRIIHMLLDFTQEMNKEDFEAGQELLEALINEFEVKRPKLFVIETLVVALRKVFTHTNYEKKTEEISEMIWSYIEEKKTC